MNKARLEKLIVALEGVKKSQFSMWTIAHECGTPACVLGHYSARRDLQRSFKLFDGYVCLSNDDLATFSVDVAKHFGISASQSNELFGEHGCGDAESPAQARRYIRKFIDTNGGMK